MNIKRTEQRVILDLHGKNEEDKIKPSQRWIIQLVLLDLSGTNCMNVAAESWPSFLCFFEPVTACKY